MPGTMAEPDKVELPSAPVPEATQPVPLVWEASWAEVHNPPSSTAGTDLDLAWRRKQVWVAPTMPWGNTSAGIRAHRRDAFGVSVIA